MKKIIALLLALLMVFSLVACGQKEEAPAAKEETKTEAPAEEKTEAPAEEKEEAPAEEERKVLKVGTVFAGWTTNDVYIKTAQHRHEREEELGIELYEKDFSADTIISTLENFISMGCDLVAIHANQAPDAVASMLPAFEEAGITVVINGTHQFQEENCVAYSLATDNYNSGYKLGQVAAEWANENIDGQVYAGVINYSSNETYKWRSMGMEDALNEHLKNGKVEASIEADGGSAEGGMKAAEDLLSAVPDLNLVLSWSGVSGMGGYEALKQANWEGGLFTFDGSKLEIEKIMEEDILISALSLDLLTNVELLIERGVEYVRNGGEYPEGTTDAEKAWYYGDNIITVDNAAEFLN